MSLSAEDKRIVRKAINESAERAIKELKKKFEDELAGVDRAKELEDLKGTIPPKSYAELEKLYLVQDALEEEIAKKQEDLAEAQRKLNKVAKALGFEKSYHGFSLPYKTRLEKRQELQEQFRTLQQRIVAAQDKAVLETISIGGGAELGKILDAFRTTLEGLTR